MGYAFAPSFSNIRVWKLGGSIKPFKDFRWMNNSTMTIDYYVYKKDVSTGPTSDPVGGFDSGRDNIGNEWNVSLKWKILSDFKSDFRVGIFRPGEVYTTSTAETYIKYKFSVDL